jgi:L-aspartate semialdehyde sulfurtransferase ferredoxin
MSHLISRRVQLNYPAERVDAPVLYHLIKEYGLIPDIRRANIDLHSGGYLVVELKGDPDDLAAALEWLELTEIAVEELGV